MTLKFTFPHMLAGIGALCMAFVTAPIRAEDFSQPNDPTWTIEVLMQEMAQVKHARAAFVERKHLAMLKEPLSFAGTLEYTAPDRLEKRTLVPKPESIVLDQGKLVMQEGDTGKSHTLAVREYPMIWAFVESIRSTLAGDLETLNRFYQVTLKGHRHIWRMQLIPRDKKTAGMVSEIQISGGDGQIRIIEFREPGGDYSVMNIGKEDS